MNLQSIRKSKRSKLILIVLLLLVCILVTPLRKQIKEFAVSKYTTSVIRLNPGNLKGIPIFMYHCIDDHVFGDPDMFVSTQKFEQQMKYIHDTGYTPVTFTQLGKISGIKKPIIITFDDGYEDNYTNAYPILEKYHFRATIFLISNAIGSRKYLGYDEIKKMEDLIDFESHTVHHHKLSKLSESSMENEIKDSKSALEKRLNKRIFVLSYPNGDYNRKVISSAEKYYSYCVTTSHFTILKNPGTYEIKRIEITNDTDISKYIK